MDTSPAAIADSRGSRAQKLAAKVPEEERSKEEEEEEEGEEPRNCGHPTTADAGRVQNTTGCAAAQASPATLALALKTLQPSFDLGRIPA